jgi:hypothetical protein
MDATYASTVAILRHIFEHEIIAVKEREALTIQDSDEGLPEPAESKTMENSGVSQLAD